MKVSLSILTVDYYNIENSIKDIIDDLDYIHMDVMDGEFVPNISFGYSFIGALNKKIDVSLIKCVAILIPVIALPTVKLLPNVKLLLELL